MFYDTECYVLDKDEVQIAKIMMDLQPYEKTIQFEDGIEIDIIVRAFCDKNKNITDTAYFFSRIL